MSHPTADLVINNAPNDVVLIMENNLIPEIALYAHGTENIISQVLSVSDFVRKNYQQLFKIIASFRSNHIVIL